MKLHFALLPLIGLCITSLSVPAETPPTSKAQGIDAKSDTWKSSVSTPFVSSPEDGSVSTNLATRDGKTDAAIYEHGLDKRTIHYFRRVVHLSLKHANTLLWSVDNAGSSAGTSVTKEVFHIDHRFANGWDGTFQFAFKAVTNAGDYFRLRLRWDDFIGPAKQGIDEITNAWCALVLPTTEEGLDQTQFSFTMTDDQSAH
ncbi:uncharacterized protein RAG0_14750 [Rhynchosporium agropyri]|uniref:Uncharacterized protein n=1 Tax=Rhynchosporium agropyri TaxID=914238 RepID=A0A1E1LI77_9HELO|nr:uncharacterized protein RAG0_14750 [Rhynchosporium agropyri]